jgi:putative ABC transport system permease protein
LEQHALTYHALSLIDLALAGLLLSANAGISFLLGLKLERTLLISAVRMVLQLGAVGFILKFVFEQGSLDLTVAFATVMVLVASWEALSRQRYRIAGAWPQWGLGTTALLFSGTAGTVYAVGLVIGTDPWWAPRMLLPILGMVLGNALTGVSLALDTFSTAVKRERGAIEAQLALGASRFEAMRDVLADALRTAMTPIINAMAAAGVVSLPGMMTGQIMAGADPVEAAKYQIMILCVIAGATALGVLIAGCGGVLLLTDARQRLRAERLVDPQSG